MAKSSNLLLYLSVFFYIITKPALAQTCSNYKFSSNTLFESCNDLPVLDSFLHYTYDSSSGNLQIAYRHTKLTSKKWVAWAVNPTSTGMVGAQAIVAYPQSDGSVRAYTSAITSYETSLQEGDLSFNVSELSATYQNNEMIIFATLTLPLANGGNINTVWQDGSLSGKNLLPHPTSGNNSRSVSTLNLISGASGGGGAGDSKIKKRNVGLQVSSWAGNQPGFSLALTVLSLSLSSVLQQLRCLLCF
ncbi:DOMON domain-containing protein [Hirschfeldia incana]|nr:DOMON domain-containing protein [Hirschfeldia incana]